MPDKPSADRTAELLLWFHRDPSRYLAEGRRRNASHLASDVVLKLALGRRVDFGDTALNDPGMTILLKGAAEAYIRNLYFHPDATPYQTLGLAPGASQETIRESFRQLMHLVHPDRQGDRKLWPDACAAQANRAYAMLRDPDARGRLEREAEARAALARAIHRAAAAAEATQMPVATWPKPKRGSRPLPRPVLPEWLTAGFGDYARRNPAVISLGVLAFGAVLVVAVTAWNGQDGVLVRGARETYATAESLIARVEPLRAQAAAPAGAPETPSNRRVNIAMADPAPLAGTRARNEVTTPSPEPRKGAMMQAVAAPAPGSVPVLPSANSTAPTAAAEPVAPAPPPAQPVPAAPASIAAPESSAIASSLQAAAPAATSPSPPPASAEIEALFASFVESYERGRLDAFTALFDDDADTNLRRGRPAIRDEYDELFRLSQWRRMQLTRVNWRRNGDRAIAKGEITVKIGWRDGREVEQRLNLDMELMRRDGRVVIARMTHQPRTP